MSERGQRGKSAEKQVEDVLKSMNTSAEFAFHRLPDARSAGSFLAAQPADFLVSCGGMKFLEVKSTKHRFRLAKDKLSQLPTLRKFHLAKTPFAVLIEHSVEGVWRAVPGEYFVARPDQPSWDLSDIPTHDSPLSALKSTGWFG